MASCTRSARFELRRNQSSIWTQINSILLPGEPGVELDTGQMKIGDGIRNWNDLPYVGTGGGGGNGTTGPTGPTGNNSLGFVNDLGNTNNATPTIAGGDPNQRDLEFFYDADGPKRIRRWIQYTSRQSGLPMFALVLASFTPDVIASFNETNLNWDQPSTGFNVNITNPTDYTEKYISDISSITAVAGGGSISALSTFTAESKVLNPSGSGLTGGISWTQRFNVNLPNGYIYSNGSAGTGGYANAKVQFIVTTAGVTSLYTTTIPDIRVNWNNPSSAFSSPTSLSGKTFLDYYDTANYVLTVYNLSYPTTNSASSISINSANTISPSSGNGSISGTVAFSAVIDYARHLTFSGTPANRPTISAVTTFTKPPNISGVAGYTFQYTPTPYQFSVSWIFPSFGTWTATANDANPGDFPIWSDIINTSRNAFNTSNPSSGYNVSTYTTPYGSGSINMSEYVGYISNPEASVRHGFWFGVYNGNTQPTHFLYSNGPNGTFADITNNGADGVRKITLDLSPAGTAANTILYTVYGFMFAGSSQSPTYIKYFI